MTGASARPSADKKALSVWPCCGLALTIIAMSTSKMSCSRNRENKGTSGSRGKCCHVLLCACFIPAIHNFFNRSKDGKPFVLAIQKCKNSAATSAYSLCLNTLDIAS